VGTWGPGIFSDDTAADVRGDYRELVEDGVPDDVVPAGGTTSRLAPVVEPAPDPGQPPRAVTWRVSRHRRKDPDWRDAGFVPAGHVPPRADDASAVAWSYVGWEALNRALERDLAG
jgi:hypothetical protein